jgi:hypothetical protein
MRIIAFIHDAHSINNIMKAQGIPDSLIRSSLGVIGQAPQLIPKFIDTSHAMVRLRSPQGDELPFYDSFEPPPDDL